MWVEIILCKKKQNKTISTFHKNNPVISLGQQSFMQFSNRYTKTEMAKQHHMKIKNVKKLGWVPNIMCLVIANWSETACVCFTHFLPSSGDSKMHMFLFFWTVGSGYAVMLCHKFKVCLALHTHPWANSGCLCVCIGNVHVCVFLGGCYWTCKRTRWRGCVRGLHM